MTIEDETWARRFRGGDTQALEEAIGEFGPSMQALVSRVLAGAGSGEDAEECVSDAFLAAWHGIDRYDRSKGSFRTWLLLLAKYKALDRRRQLLRQAEKTELKENVVTSGESTEREALDRETARELIRFVRELEEPDRSLFWRRYFQYEGLEQLAHAFGLTKKAVENRLYRCRTALKLALRLPDAEERNDDK
jgi:RNA polymerase sigma-70 factor (ECF subfamily)